MGPPSLISSGLTITGNLESDGEIQVDGTVIGDVKAERLILGEGARILGEVIADDALIRGEVTGCLRVVTVAIERSAKVHGDVYHRTLSVEAGAFIQGLCHNAENPRESGASKTGERKFDPGETADGDGAVALEPSKPVLATDHGAVKYGTTTPPWRRAQDEDRASLSVASIQPDPAYRKD